MSDALRPHGLQPTRLLRPWHFPGKSTGVGCHCLLQYLCVMKFNLQIRHSKRISELQASLFLCCGAIISTIKWKSLSHMRLFVTPSTYTAHEILQARILEWVAFPFSRGSAQPRYQTQVSLIAGIFFSSWATREAQEHWSGWLIPSPVDLPNPGIKPESPAVQVDSLPTELSRKPLSNIRVI